MADGPKVRLHWQVPSGYTPPKHGGELLERYSAGERHFRNSSAYFSRLNDADLAGVDLSNSDLHLVKLRRADLHGSNLRSADLFGADLAGANLAAADLSGANLGEANLADADLVAAHLKGADLLGANLAGTNLNNATFQRTSASRLDLSKTEGLALSCHHGRSEVELSTLHLTAQGLLQNPSNQGPVEAFFRGCGLTEEDIEYFRSLIGRPIEFYSCFISYSHTDRAFARRLYDALQGQGIRCWLDEHQAIPGDRMHDAIDRGIRMWDKVLLCCSEASLNSWWVDKEITKAMQKEELLSKQRGEDVKAVIPIMLDDHLFSGKWNSGWASEITSRFAADFTDSEKGNDKWEREFERVVKALRADVGGRATPPKPKL